MLSDGTAFCNDVTAETTSRCEHGWMPRHWIVPIVLLLVTGSAAGTSAPEPNGDLFWVRSMALVEDRTRPAPLEENIREALSRWLPGVMQSSTEDADLLIDYSSFHATGDVDVSFAGAWIEDVGLEVDALPAPQESALRTGDAQRAAPRIAAPDAKYRVSWTAKLYRLDCQSPQFGEKPTPPVDGRCENRVYVRVELGRMEGTADDEASAVQAFAAQLRQAMLTSVPSESPGH